MLPKSKLRLDAYLCARLPEVSRSQLQHGIKLGLVRVNGVVHIHSSKVVRPGDVVACTLPPPAVTTAIPQVRSRMWISQSRPAHVMEHVINCHVCNCCRIHDRRELNVLW